VSWSACCLALLPACSKERAAGNTADAGVRLLSEEEWRAATAPLTGPHEIWTAACNGSLALLPKIRVPSAAVSMAGARLGVELEPEPGRGRGPHQCHALAPVPDDYRLS
jgi:hypothetical protein